jgi:hypothetical protein
MRNLIFILVLLLPVSANAAQWRLVNNMDSKQGAVSQLGNTTGNPATADTTTTSRPAFTGANGVVYAVATNSAGYRKLYYVDASGSLQLACSINAANHDLAAQTVQYQTFGIGFGGKFYFIGINASGKSKYYYVDVLGGACALAFDANGPGVADYGLTDPISTTTFVSNDYLYLPIALSGGTNFNWYKMDSSRNTYSIPTASSFPGGNAAKTIYLFANKIVYKSSTNTQILFLDLSNDTMYKALGTETTIPIIAATTSYLYFTRLNGSARSKLFRMAVNGDVTSCGDINGAATHDVFAQGVAVTFGTKTYMLANTSVGYKLYADDGASFTQVNVNAATGSDFASATVKLTSLGHKLYFTNLTGSTSRTCYITLSSTTPVCLASSIINTNVSGPVQAGNSIAMAGLSGSASKLYRLNFDDTALQLSSINAAASNDNPDDLYFYAGKLYFSALGTGGARKLFRLSFK